MSSLRLSMSFAGAKWLEKQLSYCKKPRKVSDLGRSVADLLGFCWSGLHHMNPKSIDETVWENDRWICVKLYQGEQLASWDYDALTRLVVVGHDMGIRVSVHPNGVRGLKLGFAPRIPNSYRYDAYDRCAATQHATLEDHVANIRRGYRVEKAVEE